MIEQNFDPKRSIREYVNEDELKAIPENCNIDVYNQFYKGNTEDIITSVVYPRTFPFNLWWEEAHVYLDHLEVPRHELIQKLHSYQIFNFVL